MTPFAFVMGPMLYMGATFGPGAQPASNFSLHTHPQPVQTEVTSSVRIPSFVAPPLHTQLQVIQYRPVTMRPVRK